MRSFGFAHTKAMLRVAGRIKPSDFGDSFPVRGLHPDFLRGGYTERNPASASGQGQRVVVIAMSNMHFCSGANAPLFQELKQVTVAFVDTTDVEILSRFGLSQQHKTTTTATDGTLQFGQVPMRTGNPTAQLGEKPGFKVRGYGMFQSLRFVVQLEP